MDNKIVETENLEKRKINKLNMKNSLFSIFNRQPGLLITLSEKQDGSMKLRGDTKTIGNRENFLNKLGVDTKSVLSADLIHGDSVQAVTLQDGGKIITKTDGLLTDNKDLFLSITVADCLPIFLYDFKKEVIGLIHGGWQGLSEDILSLAVRKLTNDFKSKPEDILVGIGPGISQCHYEIKEGLLIKFKSLPSSIFMRKRGQIFLDLKKIAEIQLLNSGIKKENIEINSECTYCLPNKYFSYRRDKSEIIETMIAAIGMR